MLGMPWTRNLSAILLPLALWLACFVNALWGSKILGWAVFSVAFVTWMTVLGAFTMSWRGSPHLEVWFFARALVMYAALSLAALYPLKGVKSDASQK